MTKQEFEAIYTDKLQPKQRPVLKEFLQNKSDQQIANSLSPKVTKNCVSRHISTICQLFNIKNEQGYTQRNDLIELFVQYKPELVCEELLEEFGARASEPRKKLESPERALRFNSEFYVERSKMESDCYQEILEPGSMIRIKAPKLMGKTSLLNRIMERARTNEYRLVRLDFRDAEREIFSNTNEFLKWFCLNISQQLKLESNIDKYLQRRRGILVNCKEYFQYEILEAIDTPLVLALEEIDCIFCCDQISKDFFSMLRSWFEETRKTEIWEKLRMVLLHSTNVYVELPYNQSPFNVGFPVELAEFSQPNILDLAHRHQLSWRSDDEVATLMAMVGGYPYLVRRALYSLNDSHLSLAEILKNAATDEGIYRQHLYSNWANLQNYVQVKAAFKQVVLADSSVKLEQVLEFKLLSTGLVKQSQHGITPSCRLYRDYFAGKFRD